MCPRHFHVVPSFRSSVIRGPIFIYSDSASLMFMYANRKTINFKNKLIFYGFYIEITAWLASAYDFYARVVKDF